MDYLPAYSATSVEGLFHRALGPLLTPAARARIKEVGIDLDCPLAVAYPQETWERALGHAADAVFPAMPAEYAYTKIGRLYIAGFAETLVGRAIVKMGILIGPDRTMSRMHYNQRWSDNFHSLETEKVTPTHFRLHSSIAPGYLPRISPVPGVNVEAFIAGIYGGVLDLLKVREPRVTFSVLNPSERRVDYELRWEP